MNIQIYCYLCNEQYITFSRDGFRRGGEDVCPNCSEQIARDVRQHEELLESLKEECAVCKLRVSIRIRHHTQYVPEEKTIPVCLSCHAKIHAKRIGYDKYCPPNGERQKWFAFKKTEQYYRFNPSSSTALMLKKFGYTEMEKRL